MNDAPILRQATPADAAAISRLVTSLAPSYVLPDQPPESAEELLAWMGEAAVGERMRAGHRHLVAEVDGRLVGVVATRDESHLFLLFVDAAFHRRGIARVLWNAALAACVEAAQPERITVNASPYSVPAYRRLGFVDLGPARLDRWLITVPMEFRVRDTPAVVAGDI
jgi:GNAT superfamily N-acetyltransferase